MDGWIAVGENTGVGEKMSLCLVLTALLPPHPKMSAMENMTEKLDSFNPLKLDGPGPLQHASHPLFSFRSPPPSLPDAILRKGKERYTCRYAYTMAFQSRQITHRPLLFGG